MNLAYADPPYIGCAHLYKDHPDFAGEVDHAQLIERLEDEFDGWVLHASATLASEAILAPLVLKTGARKCAWVKGFAAFKKNVPVAYAWEPVYIKPARKPVVSKRQVNRDWIQCSITLRKGLTGPLSCSARARRMRSPTCSPGPAPSPRRGGRGAASSRCRRKHRRRSRMVFFELPSLPEPAIRSCCAIDAPERLYSAEQMRQYARGAMAASGLSATARSDHPKQGGTQGSTERALREAAEIAATWAEGLRDDKGHPGGLRVAASVASKRLRAALSSLPEEQSPKC
jgi:hypothetical protein